MFHLVRESVYLLVVLGASFSFFFLYTDLVTMSYIVLIFDIFMTMYVFFTYLYMCCFFFIFMHILLITCMQSIISISHKDVLMSFV